MEITNEYQAAYAARVLLSRSGGGVEKLSAVLLDAKVDLQPHQIAAAIFAVGNPYAKGVLLADEVGLGKTVEAGIILAQKWAEGKRKIIIVVPSMLKRQWADELSDKFYLPVNIADGAAVIAPDTINIVSYNYAYLHEAELRAIAWDVAVFDEAHKLRNVYKPDNVMAQSIFATFKDTYKILLTATPLQNSLLELYGLASFIDSHLFGDIESFKNNYVMRDNSAELAERLKTVCVRTLRKQVLEYIKYTDRYPITQDFTPSADEQALYDMTAEYVYEKSSVMKKLPKHLVGIMLLKQLSSSPKALSATLTKLKNTLTSALKSKAAEVTLLVAGDEESTEEQEQFRVSVGDIDNLAEEIEHLDFLIVKAENIGVSAKLSALVAALTRAFERLKKIGAAEKAVIFTESLKTQEYIVKHLTADGRFGVDDVLSINGGTLNRGEVLDKFKNGGKILVSTEVGGEGLNLQFCSLVVNFDMPWNPQRVEQRIGRCHRYGQKFDVAVVNLISTANYAERRLYELLSEKFKLFKGVFGASDTVLGALEETDFEGRVAEIYLNCRTAEEIDAAFSALQADCDAEIKTTLKAAKSKVFEYLDADVAARFKEIENSITALLSRREKLFWDLTRYQLKGAATFSDKNPLSLVMHNQRYAGRRFGSLIYRFDKSASLGERYRPECALGKEVLFQAEYGARNSARLSFSLSGNPKVSALERLRGKRGSMALFSLTAKGEYFSSDFLLVGLSGGEVLDGELCEKLLMLNAANVHRSYADTDDKGKIKSVQEIVGDKPREELTAALAAYLPTYAERLKHKVQDKFGEQVKTLERWAADKSAAAERKIAPMLKKIADTKAAAQKERDFNKKVALLNEVKALEKDYAERQMKLYAEQEKIAAELGQLIERTRTKLNADYVGKQEFVIEWEICK